jgi:hypothetical protein
MRPEARPRKSGGPDPWARVAVAVWILLVAAVCCRGAAQPRERSLYPTWAAVGRDWLVGRDVYRRQIQPGEELYRYCPPVTAALVPLTWVPERAGNFLWRLFNAATLLAGLTWWLRSTAPEATTRRERAVLFLLVAPLALSSLNNAQVNPLLTGLLLGSLAAVAAKRWTLAAACAALASALKIYPLALGLLLVVAYPRRFGLRFVAALLVVAALPFLLQRPAYVAREYAAWFESVRHGDLHRRTGPENLRYRDLWLVLQVWNVPIKQSVYVILQLASAAGCAVLALAARLRGWPAQRVLEVVMVTGCGWMLLCGPATESPTYVLLAPAVGWALLTAHRPGAPAGERPLLVFAYGLLLLCVLAGVSPSGSCFQNLGLQPLAVLLLAGCFLARTVHALLGPRAASHENPSAADLVPAAPVRAA